MLRVSVKSGPGNKMAFNSLKGLPASIRKGIQQAFIKERPELKKDTIDDMQKSKSGRDYFVYVSTSGRRLKRGRWHKASKVGESPAVLSGDLKRSLGFRIKNGKILTYGANTPYARKHELGGRSYLGRSIFKRRNEIGYRIRDEINIKITGKAKG